MTRGRTRAVVNAHEIITGDFTRDRGFRLPTDRLTLALRARLGEDGLRVLDATRLAEQLLGDAIYANVLMLGAAWQAGLVPLGEEALAPRDRDQRRRRRGQHEPPSPSGAGRSRTRATPRAAATPPAPPPAEDLDTIVERRAAHLADYQGDAPRPPLPRPHRRGARRSTPSFAAAMAKGYHKLLAYKDEYEVARLHAETLEAAVDAQFTDVRAMRFHLAPPILGGTDASRPAEEARVRPVDAARLRRAAAVQGACAARRSTPSATPPSGGWSGR